MVILQSMGLEDKIDCIGPKYCHPQYGLLLVIQFISTTYEKIEAIF